jgi:hypothetical protein
MKVLEKSDHEEDKPETSSKDNLRFLKEKYKQARAK